MLRASALLTLLGLPFAAHASVEACDGVDNDGDGDIDELDCGEDDCDTIIPDDCIDIWQAAARGWISVTTETAGVEVRITNLGPYEVCVDDQVFWESGDTQNLFLDHLTLGYRIGSGGDYLASYYASYTTDNGTFSPYLGESAWWCGESGQSVFAGQTFAWTGEGVPEGIIELVNSDTDLDGDGVSDREDWVDDKGVQTNYNVWDYEETHTVITVGKVAEIVGTTVEVTVLARNVGAIDGDATVTDVVPAGWTLASLPSGASSSTGSDGTTVITWDVSLLGSSGGAGTGVETLTYVLTSGDDVPYQEFEPATVEYDDGDELRSGESLPAAVYMFDADGDGTVVCYENEICDEIDNDGDGLIDEGWVLELGDVTGYNVVAFADYMGGVDVEGAAAAGGSIQMQYFSVGLGLGTGDVLVAGDSLDLDAGTVWGDAWYGVSASITESVDVRGVATQGDRIDWASVESAVITASTLLQSLTVNGSTTVESWGGIRLEGSDAALNVFEVDGADLSDCVQFNIDVPSGSVVVVNVSGASISLSNFAMLYSGVDASDVVFNFFDASEIDVQAFGFVGSALAPYAAVTFNNGSWDGTLVAASVEGNGEFHLFPFDGEITGECIEEEDGGDDGGDDGGEYPGEEDTGGTDEGGEDTGEVPEPPSQDVQSAPAWVMSCSSTGSSSGFGLVAALLGGVALLARRRE